MIGNYKAIQQENFHLREYIIQLQGRLLERHDDVPPPPASIDLSNPPQRPTEDGPARAASMTTTAVEELQMAARAAEQAAAITGSGGQEGRADWAFINSRGYAQGLQVNPPERPAHDDSIWARSEVSRLPNRSLQGFVDNWHSDRTASFIRSQWVTEGGPHGLDIRPFLRRRLDGGSDH